MKKIFALLTFTLLATACDNTQETTTTQTNTTQTVSATATETASGEQAAAAPTTGEGATTIGMSISTLNNPFFVELRDGAQAAADAGSAELTVLDAQDRADKQASDIEDLVTRGVDVILVNATDSDAIVPSIMTANEAGIPVITVDRSANGGQVAYHIASDNVAGGKLAGEFIRDQLGGSGNVVELQGVPGSSAARDRGEGFNIIVKENPGMNVVAAQPADFNRAKGLSVMENILQAQPEIDAVFAHNDEMALGALQAITAADRDIMVVGFDATPDAVDAVKGGTLAATVAQKPGDIGRLGVEKALEVVSSGNVPATTENVPVDLELIK
ncbi:periplasmic binding protein/LacI transcriptional regulator [Deinococcus proteolyticus MRP]|uniref:Periplasmic binding protein/LacI transcriptional regulator n=1 Tax=Deinococcus proteolyticus (strain ATCC 35074 / DSM 20540 / JCM 6276 / NBRC 101906 / NCIMB 13154 / VKM Ac-1939 / CCM 2703 / MRP) TaxID=693977 RepID=F0RJP6_DEIPM|nr:D-ribose ABC transporter substrate-binding protein [Deinococcus proteolyticus]ADY26616.1 periplasmic binding protein/LacI transcriptional regulator [Deinococcus proteolyticus MRP]